MTDSVQTGHPVSKHRIEALSDGIYAIAMTLLVLELKLAPLPASVSNAAIGAALIDLLPKALTWLLSFWVMAVFWLAQQRTYRLLASLDSALIWIELRQLALVGLLPFSTALMGEHGSLPTVSALYASHLLLMALSSWWRTAHLLRRPGLWAGDIGAEAARSLRLRAWILTGCTFASVLLAFVAPAYNMLALLPIALLPSLARY